MVNELAIQKVSKLRGIISYFGARSDPCCMRAPILCQRQLSRLRPFSNSSGSDSQGWALSHSWGLSLKNKEHRVLTMFFHNINRFKYTLSSGHFKSIRIILVVHHVWSWRGQQRSKVNGHQLRCVLENNRIKDETSMRKNKCQCKLHCLGESL